MSEQNGLSEFLLSEVALAEALNVTKPVIDGLRREKGLPFVRLTTKDRCYLISDILEWCKSHKATL